MIRSMQELLRSQKRHLPVESAEVSQAAAAAAEAGPIAFFAVITGCDILTGIVTVRKVAGTLGAELSSSLGEVADASDITAWQGPYGWHRVGDYVLVLQIQGVVSPRFVVIQRIGGLGMFEAPAEEDLASVQDEPTVRTSCEEEEA